MAKEITVCPKYSIGDIIYQKDSNLVRCYIICGIDARIQNGAFYYSQLYSLKNSAQTINDLNRTSIFYTAIDEDNFTSVFSEDSIDKNFCLSIDEYKDTFFKRVLEKIDSKKNLNE